MSLLVETRSLIPSYLFRSTVLAWKCSLCHKLFCVTPEEAEERKDVTPPGEVQYAFRVHSCALVLLDEAEVGCSRLCSAIWKE